MITFTLADANRTLPLVSRIVQDLVLRYPRWRALVDEYELVTVSQRADMPDPRVSELERQVTALAGAYGPQYQHLDPRTTVTV